jgi:hypothetical protein
MIMVKPTFDRNLFTQIGLDSASLSMLGSIVHTFSEAGEYRGVLHRGEQIKAVFYITVDRSSPVAQATIDLAALERRAQPPVGQTDDRCCSKTDEAARGGNHFSLNPRGYTLFHVASGAGGYHVNVRRIDAEQSQRGYDSRVLAEGDIFSAIIIRPGRYSMTNASTKASGEIVVSYPQIGDKAYRPPNPVRVECGPASFEPARVALQPGQGVLFHARVHSHIVIHLLQPDDGPTKQPAVPGRAGWRKSSLT